MDVLLRAQLIQVCIQKLAFSQGSDVQCRTPHRRAAACAADPGMHSEACFLSGLRCIVQDVTWMCCCGRS